MASDIAGSEIDLGVVTGVPQFVIGHPMAACGVDIAKREHLPP
jgi:hypothetical protein